MNATDRAKADHRLSVCPYRHIKRAATRVSQDGKAYIGTEQIAVCGDADTLDHAREACLHCKTVFQLPDTDRPIASLLRRIFKLAAT